MKILVVDDSPTMRRIFVNTLRRAGYGEAEIIESESYGEALEKLYAEKFDLVIGDWGTPDMDGEVFVLTVRAHYRLKKLPLLFAHYRNTAEPTFTAKVGPVAFITKPFAPELLDGKIKHLIALNR